MNRGFSVRNFFKQQELDSGGWCYKMDYKNNRCKGAVAAYLA